MANLLFDLMQKRKVNLPRRVIDMYFRGLKVRRKPDNTKTSVNQVISMCFLIYILFYFCCSGVKFQKVIPGSS